MNKTKVLSFLVIVLVALNITSLMVFVLNKAHHPPHQSIEKGPKNIIIKKLHFNKKQVIAYEGLIKEHRLKIESIDNKIKSLKTELYLLLKEDNHEKSKDLINQINSLQKEIENHHYQHFIAIKKLCKDEQIQHFNNLTNELAKLFSPHPKPQK